MTFWAQEIKIWLCCFIQTLWSTWVSEEPLQNRKIATNVTEVSWSRKNNTQLTEITEHNETKEEEITRESSS